jgi:putative DNA methylase
MAKERRLIESTKFPIDLVNDKSGGEKQGGGRPPFWEMVFWWTRKPLIGARSIIAASLLPEDVDVEKFEKKVMLNEKTPHRYDPDIPDEWMKYFDGKRLFDPFAGFGSIPLEGSRLGLDITASELLPTPYIFLKCVLDYPSKYGKELVEGVKKWGDWVTERLRDDDDMRELYEYDEDVAVYIGSWEVRCPHCYKWTPLIGNWWLARVKDKKGYKRLAFIDYEKRDDDIGIKVVDINDVVKKEVARTGLGKANDIIANAKVDPKSGEIFIGGEGKAREGERKYEVPSSNLESRRKQATCLNCGSLIRFVDSEGDHYIDKKDVPKENRDNLEWFVKWALKRYHDGDEQFARQRLFVKVKKINGDLVFEPCDEGDNKKLERAKKKIKELEREGDADIPTEPIPPYGSLLFGALQIVGFGMTNWYKLFNPRQLLTIVKLVKLIREAGKKAEEEKIKEGWEKEEAFDYAEAVVSYLASALCKFIDYNSICAGWNQSLIMGHSLSMRGIAMIWNFFEENPFIKWTGSWYRNMEALLDNLNYFKSAHHLAKRKNAETELFNKVLIDDATTLSKINEKFDIIVTDPPYADDVAYTELSDFYYVWLKRALSDIEDRKLVPRFHANAFFKKIGYKDVEIKTQWQELAKREVSTQAGRFLGNGNHYKRAAEHFQNLLTQSFISMGDHLKEDGLLVTYYAHTSPDAWATLLSAGWKGAKATITNAFPLTTESAQSVVSRGKLALNTSIVVVWRIGKQEEERNILDIQDEIIESAKKRAKELIGDGYIGRDILVGTMAAALNIVTKYKELYDSREILTVNKLLVDYIYPFTAIGIAESLREMVIIESLRRKANVGKITSPEALFYLLVKSLFSSKEKMTTKRMDRNDIYLLRISTKVDVNKLKNANIIEKVGDKYRLEEPNSHEISAIERFLKERKINLAKPKIINSVDMLHIMEYYSQLYPLKKLKEKWEGMEEKYPIETKECFTLASILYQILPKIDDEKMLAGEFVSGIRGEKLEVEV